MDDLDRQLRGFLAADAHGDAEAADRALARVFRALPALEPAGDLVARVMLRIERPPVDLAWPARIVTVAAFLLLAIAWINLSPTTLFWHADLSAALATGADLLGRVARRAGDLVVFGRLLRQLGDAAFAVLGNPTVQMVLLALLASTSALSRWVYVLIGHDPRRAAR